MASTITVFDHLKIPLEKILEATNNFDDKNVIGEGGFGKVYKGKLLDYGILKNISARRLDRKHGQGDVEFWTEISALSVLNCPPHIVKMIGFCDENDEKIIITHYDIKGSLSMFLSDPTTFSLQDRFSACYYIASAINFIYGSEGSAFSFIHRNINSSTILLDENWKAKLSGFEFSIRSSSLARKNFNIHSEVIGTQGYIDPTYLKTGSVTHKSDVYSLGVVLFEILCGRHAYNPNEQDDKKFLAPLAKYHYEKGTLQDIIHPELWDQVASDSYAKMELEKISKIAYSCLNKERAQRPDMHEVVYELEKQVRLSFHIGSFIFSFIIVSYTSSSVHK
ncbi:serine-threonine/tyrosine-protein kinase catalytic domain-containing protein [Artemisia annua]|uniref:Serine-threonine/tyrosine-protein kinase catalytic domain-containing protein n=1 Tax=Artemisia annua TaxID=35608 RepID=A0A2U1MHP5_ARTAN|nr:serine-threonine/tyrosine-protein kinase catalytic domain-containing protein [Artemisia annua]